MEQLFLEIVNRGLTASILVLAVLMVRFIFQRAPKRFRCVLWALVGFRLLCPFSVESVFSLVPNVETVVQAVEETAQEQAVVSENILSVVQESQDYITVPETVVIPEMKANSQVSHSAEQPLIKTSGSVSLQTVGICVWLAGMAAMGLYGVFSYLKVKKQVKISLHDKENIYYCDTIETPFAFGMFPAKIYLPSGLNEVTAEYVVRHEKEHLRCKDQWWKLLGFLLLAVYWFHPLIWVAYILFCKDIEYACDKRVVKELNVDERKAYATALLDCSIGKKVLLFCPTAFGETSVKGRIRSALSYRKATLPIVLCAVALVALLVVAFLTDPVKKQEDMFTDLKTSTFSAKEGLNDMRVYCYSDNPVLERVVFLGDTESMDSPEQLVSMEKWDGEYWRVLSEGSWKEAVTATPNGNTVRVDLTKEWERYGEGLYRLVWNAASSDAEPCYYAKEIRLIDYAHIEDRATLGSLLTVEGEVTNVTIMKNADSVSLAEQSRKELLEFLNNMECVALRDMSATLGGNSNDSLCMIQFSEDITLKIKGSSGKTLDGREYSAICSWSGMGEELLLYSKEGSWLEFLQKQLSLVSPTPALGILCDLPPRTMIDGDIVQLRGRFTPIISIFQEKIEQAEYCGVIRNISGSKYPTEELESNSFQDGCKAYHYQDEFMETYIIVDPEGTKCFFADGWTKYQWGETQLIKVEEQEVNIFPTPVPKE